MGWLNLIEKLEHTFGQVWESSIYWLTKKLSTRRRGKFSPRVYTHSAPGKVSYCSTPG